VHEVRLVIHPGETVLFDSFCLEPPVAVALDGYVPGPSVSARSGHFSFNHHEGVDRFTTRATCEQIALALRAHAPITGTGTSVHVNDDDPDVALAWWLLTHPDRVSERAVEHLCVLQGAIDTYGGSVSTGGVEDLEALAWMIDPWVQRRTSGILTADALRASLDGTCERITRHVDGTGDTLTGNWGYDLVASRGHIWVIVEHHPLARARACRDGCDVYIAVRDSIRNGVPHRDVTIGRASPYVDYDLIAVYADLNHDEPCTAPDMWGGSDLVGGSPRYAGTALDLDTILDRVEARRFS
jgi:hypothetical protein